jgi:DNA-binding protein HU-beta
MRAAGYHILIIFAALFKNLTIMTKAEIVKEVSKSTGIEATTVMAVVEGFMEVVKGSLAKDNNVYLRGFGTFAVQTRAQKTARNITKNTTVIIPEHKVPTFKPCADFKSQVK